MKVFLFKTKSPFKAGFLLAFLSLISALLGVLRDALLAFTFGASRELDLYYASFRIPDFLYSILIFGATSAAFIPLFNQVLKKDPNKAFLFANQFLRFIFLILLGASCLLFLLTPFLVKKIIVPGFDLNSQKEVIFFSRLLLFQFILLGISSVFGSLLQSFERFFLSGLAPIFYNLGILSGILIFSKFLGILGVILGVIFGAFLHFLIQFLGAKKLGFSFKLKSEKIFSFKKIFNLFLPRSLSLFSRQISLIIITALASTIGFGALSIFNLVSNLTFFGANLIGASFAMAAFPKLSRLKEEKSAFKKFFEKFFLKIFLILLLLTLFYLLFGKFILKLVLAHGKFLPSFDLALKVLMIFSLSIIPWGSAPILLRAFFALEDSLTPFLIGIFSDLFFLILAFFFTQKFQLFGLAFSFTFLCWFQFLLLIFTLKKFKLTSS